MSTTMNSGVVKNSETSRARPPFRRVVAGEITTNTSSPNHLTGWPGAVTRNFFADGDRHEMTGWQDAVIPRDASERDPERDVRTFDRVPRRLAPLVTVVALAMLTIGGFAASRTGASSVAYQRLASSTLAQRATGAVQSLRRMTRPSIAIAP